MLDNFTIGIDVSHWQNNKSTPQRVDFVTAFNSGARFVFIKASQGVTADSDLAYNWKNAKTAGLLRGAYHFLVWDVSPAKQAHFFWNLIKDDPGELPPILDFESWKVTPKNANDLLWQFFEELQKLTPRIPIIYTSIGFWNPYGSKSLGWKKYPLWVANYYVSEPAIPLPWKEWKFWQFTSKGDGGKFGCESKSVDLNYINGSYEDLLKFSRETCNGHQSDEPEEEVPLPYKAKVNTVWGVNVREKPYQNSKKIMAFRYLKTVEVLKEQDGWGYVTDGMFVGWSDLRYFEKVG